MFRSAGKQCLFGRSLVLNWGGEMSTRIGGIFRRAELKVLSGFSFLTCIAVGVAFSGSVGAGTIYSTFLPGNQYACCSGYQAAGSVPNGVPFAAAFTPTQNSNLSQIDVAVWSGAAPSEPFTLTINQDSGGQP